MKTETEKKWYLFLAGRGNDWWNKGDFHQEFEKPGLDGWGDQSSGRGEGNLKDFDF